MENENKENHNSAVPAGYVGIYTIEDLNDMRSNYAGQYILMNDLDFNNDDSYTAPINKTNYTTGLGWLSVGDPDNYFTGIFDGNNYTISNLLMNRPLENRCGLFGSVNGDIHNIGLENVDIICDSRTGSLVGSLLDSGTLINSYATGEVSKDYRIGGLVGNNFSGGFIENCYSAVNVVGRDSVGGLAGFDYLSIIKNSFSVGDITGTTNVGVLGGEKNDSAYANVFRNSESLLVGAENEYIDDRVIGSNYFEEDLFYSTVLNWDLEDTWYIPAVGYPKLGGTTNVVNSPIVYNITTIEDLFGMHRDPTGTYVLLNDLDFENDSDYSDVSNKEMFLSNEGWLPIGKEALNVNIIPGGGGFRGSFDGGGHIIKNLYINTTENYVGLFGYIKFTTSVIQRVGL